MTERSRIVLGDLVAVEPTLDEVILHARQLAGAYNDPHNAPLLGHAEEVSRHDVVDHYRCLMDDGDRPFLLYRDGDLVGDGDLRGVSEGAAEIAFLIAARSDQGRGFGTRLALMITVFGFRVLGLHHVYASVAPTNAASMRVFTKLGFACDDSETARGYAEVPEDVTFAIDRDAFEIANAQAIVAVRFEKA